MNKVAYLLPVLLSGTLGACSQLTPPPESARVVPAAWTATAPGEIADAHLDRWWKIFGDPVLDGLVDATLTDNPDLVGARARLRAARAAARVSDARQLPDVGGSASLGVRRDEQQTELFRQRDATQSFFEAGFDASWELDVFGGVHAAQVAAAEDAAAAAFAAEAVQVTLAAEVAREYFGLRGAQARLAVADRNIALQEEALGLLRSRARAGLASELDVAKADTDLAGLRALRAPLVDAIAQSGHRLMVLSGRTPGGLAPALAVPAPLPATPTWPDLGLPSDMLARRPDLRRARAAVLAANARVGVARADLFPKFTLSGLFAAAGETGPQIRLGPGLVFALAPSVRLPIFTAGRLRAQVEIRDAELESAVAAHDAVLLEALREVEGAASSAAQEGRRLVALDAAVASARRARALALSRQQSGVDDYFAVIDAQRALYGSEDLQAASATARMQHLVALYKALGGGWDAAAYASR